MRTIFFTVVFVVLGWYALVNMTVGLVGLVSPDLPMFSQN